MASPHHPAAAVVLALVAASTAAPSLAASQDPRAANAPHRPFALEDVVAFRTIGALSVSPDGRFAAFTVRSADTKANRFGTDLWIVSLDGKQPARQLTFAQGSATRPKWSPDGTTLAFLSDRGGTAQVWALTRDGEVAARPLTAHAQPVSDFDWAPDGRSLLVTAPDEETAGQARRRKEGDDGYLLGEEWRNDRLFIGDIPSVAGPGAPPAIDQRPDPAPARLRPLTDGRRHAREGAVVSPDGRRVAFVSTPTAEEDAYEEAAVQVLEIETGEVREVRGGARAVSPAWSPDGRYLAFIRPFDGKGIARADLFLWPAVPGARKDGDDTARDVTASLDREIEEFRFTPDGAAIDLFYSEGAVHALSRLDLTGLRREIGGRTIGTLGPPRTVWAPGFTINLPQRAGPAWIFVRGDLPAEIWKAAPPRPGRPLTAINEAIAALALPSTETFRWKGPDGPLEGVLIKPRDYDPKRTYPLILRPHGGPRLNSTVDLDPTVLYFASRGYIVLKPNFRGSTGYGDAFTRGNVADWGNGPLRDVLSGADALIARGLVDGNRLFWYGWSYSGYLANWAITHTTRLRAAVSGAGVADLRMQYILSDARRWRFDYFGGSPFTGHWDMYSRESPVTYAGAARVPTLFISGEKDERCPLPQSLMMHRALQDAGIETALLIHPREGHEYHEPRHILDRARRAAEWFGAHDLKPAPR